MIPKDPDFSLANSNYDIKNNNWILLITNSNDLPNIPVLDTITLMGWVSVGILRILKIFILCVYLAMACLSWCMLDLGSLLLHAGSLLGSWEVLLAICRI